MKTYAEKRFFEWHEDDVSVTLRNKSGSYGGGSEVLVVCGGFLLSDSDGGGDDDSDGGEDGRPSYPMRGN